MVYNDVPAAWLAALSPEVAAEVALGKQGSFPNFPFYSTLGQVGGLVISQRGVGAALLHARLTVWAGKGFDGLARAFLFSPLSFLSFCAHLAFRPLTPHKPDSPLRGGGRAPCGHADLDRGTELRPGLAARGRLPRLPVTGGRGNVRNGVGPASTRPRKALASLRPASYVSSVRERAWLETPS